MAGGEVSFPEAALYMASSEGGGGGSADRFPGIEGGVFNLPIFRKSRTRSGLVFFPPSRTAALFGGRVGTE